MKQMTWAQFLCCLAVVMAIYYGILYFFGKSRRKRSVFLTPRQARISPELSSPSYSLIEQKNAVTDFLKPQQEKERIVQSETTETKIEFTVDETISNTSLELDEVSDNGIDLEKLIFTFELASKSAVSEKERDELKQNAGCLYDDAYFQQLLTSNETIKQKVQSALLEADNKAEHSRMYVTEEEFA